MGGIFAVSLRHRTEHGMLGWTDVEVVGTREGIARRRKDAHQDAEVPGEQTEPRTTEAQCRRVPRGSGVRGFSYGNRNPLLLHAATRRRGQPGVRQDRRRDRGLLCDGGLQWDLRVGSHDGAVREGQTSLTSGG